MPILAISINWEGSSLWLIPLLLAGIAFTVWDYRRTVPQISPFFRILLTIMRAIALCILLILFFNPLMIFEMQKKSLPELALLIDESASMGLNDKGNTRAQIVQNILGPKNLSQLKHLFNLRVFTFSDTVTETINWNVDSLKFVGTSTNIAQALLCVQQVIDNSNGAILLITDGAYNSGSDPTRIAQNIPFPIFTTCIGDSTPAKDLSIAEIRVNPLVYLGDEIPLEVTIQGFPGAVTVLKLISPEGKEIGRENINFHLSSNEMRKKISFKADEVGAQIYTLALNEIGDEISDENNLRHFAVKVLESRIDILLIAGSPSSDLAFITRILKRNRNLNLQTLIQQKGGRFYPYGEAKSPTKFDLIILLNYPTVDSERGFLKQICQDVENGKPLVIIPGVSFRPDLLKSIATFLPADFGVKNIEIPIKLKPDPEVSPLVNFFPENVDWNNLPPVRTFPGWVKIRSSASVLARMEKGEPAIGFQVTGGEKTMILAVHDLWRLSLQDPEHSFSDSLVSTFWHSAIRWLATREEEDLFRISTGKDIFTSGETVSFTARLYDKTYRPLSGAMVRIEIKGPEGALPMNLSPTGDEDYSATARFNREGNYKYEGIASFGKDSLFTKGQFTVETFNPEFLNSRMRPDILRNLANSSGGKFYFPSDFAQFFRDYAPQPIDFVEKKELKIFPRWITLIILLGLLSIEWIIRKRKGML